ncbi:O-antigen polysaccharide polymerase Wzy [Aeromonas hydrophila]|uniref:O-antigen polysaccharide polymerase Wzy n=1 Tax=Aeromonas hydrophila TaxID=644 RepID=UPI003019CEA9
MLKKWFFLDFIFVLFLALSSFILFLDDIDAFPYLISLVSFYLVLAAYIRQGFYSFHFLFSVSFVLFNSSRYILDFGGGGNVREIIYFANYIMDSSAYTTQSVCLLAFLFCILFFVNIDRRELKLFKYLHLTHVQKIALLFTFLFSMMFQVYKVKILLSLGEGGGYIDFQRDYEHYITMVPAIVRYFSYFFPISFFAILTSVRVNENVFKLISILYLIVLAYTTSLGGRALFFTSLLILIWLYGRLYCKKTVTISWLLLMSLGALFLLGLGQLVVANRMGDSGPSISMVIPLVLYDQGTSITVFSLMYKNMDVVFSFNVLFEHLLRYIYMPFGGGLSALGFRADISSFVEVMAKSIDPTSVEIGYGLGGNLMAELYLYFHLFSVFIFYGLLKLYRRIGDISGGGYFYLLVPISMQSILFSPRSYAFDFLIDVGRNFIYVIFLTFFLLMIKAISSSSK